MTFVHEKSSVSAAFWHCHVRSPVIWHKIPRHTYDSYGTACMVYLPTNTGWLFWKMLQHISQSVYFTSSYVYIYIHFYCYNNKNDCYYYYYYYVFYCNIIIISIFIITYVWLSAYLSIHRSIHLHTMTIYYSHDNWQNPPSMVPKMDG